MKSYIYALLDPFERSFAYVGKSIRPKTRFFEHLRCNDTNDAKNRWIEFLLMNKACPIFYILKETTTIEENADELYWIKELKKAGYDLLNIVHVRPHDKRPSKLSRKEIRKRRKAMQAQFVKKGIVQQKKYYRSSYRRTTDLVITEEDRLHLHESAVSDYWANQSRKRRGLPLL